MSELTREQMIGDIRECVQVASMKPDLSIPQDPNEYISQLRATITQQAQELERVKAVETVLRDYGQFKYEPKEGLAHLACSVRDVCDDLKIALRENEVLQEQLAASPARCREMEAEATSLGYDSIQALSDGYIDIINERQEIRDYLDILNMPTVDALDTIKQRIAQLQATLAAREATIKGYRHSFEIMGRNHDDRRAERDAAVQEVGRLRLTWTTARPTVAGWYWWRDATKFSYAVLVFPDVHIGLTAKGGFWEKAKIVCEMDGEWAGPIPLPTEAQQARGSSGGAANQGAGA